MFYRRKIILSILQTWGNTLDKISLQKILFLFSVKQTEPVYEFVPYRFGCYSFSVNADLNAMKQQKLIDECRIAISKTDKRNYVAKLTHDDKRILIDLRIKFLSLSARALMRHVYKEYSYYATKSERAKELLSAEEYQAIRQSMPWSNKYVLFTIGYEGISLEAYLNKLIHNDVKVLCDVRRNPLSMKFGFSKESLRKYCEALGISYVHFPSLGIASEFRKDISTQYDYDKLFGMYGRETLAKNETDQQEIIKLLNEHKRVALTCFEAEICRCHRKPLSQAIIEKVDNKFELLHI